MDVENEFIIPLRVKVFGFGLSPVMLVIEVDLDERTGGPLTVFGHEVSGIMNFHDEFGHGGYRDEKEEEDDIMI